MAVLARSHIFTSVKTRRVKLVKLELQAKGRAINSKAYTTATVSAKHARATCAAWLCESWVYASYFSRVALRNWLCASWLCASLLGAMCFARTAPRNFSRKWSAQAASFQAAARKFLSARRKRSMQVALRKCSEQVALRQLLRSSALRMCSVQVALRKLLCASCSEQVLPELWECTSRTIFCT